MQARKASEFQRPTSMMVYICSLAKCIIVAGEALTEWVPISLLVEPKMLTPVVSTEHLRLMIISVVVILETFLPL